MLAAAFVLKGRYNDVTIQSCDTILLDAKFTCVMFYAIGYGRVEKEINS